MDRKPDNSDGLNSAPYEPAFLVCTACKQPIIFQAAEVIKGQRKGGPGVLVCKRCDRKLPLRLVESLSDGIDRMVDREEWGNA